MLLTVAETARLLQSDERTVRQWIKKEGLPACTVNDKLRLNRVDVLEWATDRGMKVSPEIFVPADSEEDELPSLSQALTAGGIHYRVPGAEKLAVLKQVVDLLPLPSHIDREFVLQVLLAREALGTTAIGDGIAIPHVRNPILLHVAAPSITLCFLTEPIDFLAVDGKPVHTLFTLISPIVKTHLHLLAKLAYALRDPRFAEVLRKQSDPSEIMAAVRAVEAGIS